MPWYKNKKNLSLIGAGVLGVILLVLLINSKQETVREVIIEPGSNEIAVVGTISCMPLRSGATTTDVSCVKGIAGDNGIFYALDTMAIGRPEDSIMIGSNVEAVGVYKVATTSAESQVFLYDGVLTARILRRVQGQ